MIELPPVPGQSDAQLVARCRGGEQAAWDVMVERYSRYVFAILKQAFRLSDDDAEEVFQEVFARMCKHLGSLRADEAIRPWIGQLTRRCALDRLRARRPEMVPGDLPEPGEIDAALERLGDAMVVRESLAALPAVCQEMLDRFYTRDESYRTIGQALGIPTGTVSSRIARCLERLRIVLVAGERAGAGTARHGG